MLRRGRGGGGGGGGMRGCAWGNDPDRVAGGVAGGSATGKGGGGEGWLGFGNGLETGFGTGVAIVGPIAFREPLCGGGGGAIVMRRSPAFGLRAVQTTTLALPIVNASPA